MTTNITKCPFSCECPCIFQFCAFAWSFYHAKFLSGDLRVSLFWSLHCCWAHINNYNHASGTTTLGSKDKNYQLAFFLHNTAFSIVGIALFWLKKKRGNRCSDDAGQLGSPWQLVLNQRWVLAQDIEELLKHLLLAIVHPKCWCLRQYGIIICSTLDSREWVIVLSMYLVVLKEWLEKCLLRQRIAK